MSGIPVVVPRMLGEKETQTCDSTKAERKQTAACPYRGNRPAIRRNREEMSCRSSDRLKPPKNRWPETLEPQKNTTKNTIHKQPGTAANNCSQQITKTHAANSQAASKYTLNIK
jgi:hypothetical protein